jgi:hypothetical protein
MIPVNWIKNMPGESYLRHIDPDDEFFNNLTGVCVIYDVDWNKQSGKIIRRVVLKIDGGEIREQIRAGKHDPQLIAFQELMVACAEIAPSSQDGVVRYLKDQMQPLFNADGPDCKPIPVYPLPF